MCFTEEKYKQPIIFVKMYNLTNHPRIQIKIVRNYARHNIKGKLAWMLNNRNIYSLLMNIGYFLEKQSALSNKVESMHFL